MKKYNTLIWDWNGTLLNDVWLALEVMNKLLLSRQLPLLSREKYLEVFDFPVKDYYAKLGFDFSKEPFEVIGNEFIVEYDARHLDCELHSGAIEMLKHFKNSDKRQFVLSARNQIQLENEFEHFGIKPYFESFSGLSDNYANGKTELGLQLIESQNINRNTTVMIGDTVHDYEVAEVMGIDCILVEGGHHSTRRLKQKTSCVIENLSFLTTVMG